MVMMKKNNSNSQVVKGGGGNNRLLISINVLGSPGPLRFLVNEEELVVAVIQTALRNYAREGRLPILGSDIHTFLLYSANAGTDALSPWEMIGSRGGRNFVLCKKPPVQQELVMASKKTMVDGDVRMTRKSTGSWKSWINKSLNFKISSH